MYIDFQPGNRNEGKKILCINECHLRLTSVYIYVFFVLESLEAYTMVYVCMCVYVCLKIRIKKES